MKLEPGDIVRLKSGGESMTVEEVDGDWISCVWSSNKKIERQGFPAITLEKLPTGLSLA